MQFQTARTIVEVEQVSFKIPNIIRRIHNCGCLSSGTLPQALATLQHQIVADHVV